MLLAIAVAGAVALAQTKPMQPCQGFEAVLSTTSTSVARGKSPQFHLRLRNTSEVALRFIDTRAGRRPDLGNNYYDLVLQTRAGQDVMLPTAISDPGPVSERDYFPIEPGGSSEIGITTPMNTDELKRGSYRAYVVLRDPYGRRQECRSTVQEFRVQ